MRTAIGIATRLALLAGFATSGFATPAFARDGAPCPADEATLAQIREARLRGHLDEAVESSSVALACDESAAAIRARLHLELARIHDRYGLHNNSRPVAAALEEIERAAAQAAEAVEREELAAEIEYARGYYHYRAEGSASGFPTARAHVDATIARLSEDSHLLADAIHLLGLIEMQSGNLDRALELYDESLAIDRTTGVRDHFLGDYHRHVAFVLGRQGRPTEALEHYRLSHAARLRAGAIDASLFSGASLGSALIGLDRPEEALALLRDALEVAERIGSSRGVATASLGLGRALEATGDPAGAAAAYRRAEERARAIGLDSMADRAAQALERVAGS